jgi:acetyl-CoA carboxylase carboxyl transferase subunit beta
MPRSTIAVQLVKEAGLPYIVVLTDPTTGGVTASFAMLGDLHIAEKGAQIGFAGARVIEDTIRETLPEGFQRSEYLMEHGMVDMVVHRRDLRGTLIRVLDLLGRPGPTAEIVTLPKAEPEPVAAPVEAEPLETVEAAPVAPTSAQTQSGETLEPAGDRTDR